MKNKENLMRMKKDYLKIPNKILRMSLNSVETMLYVYLASCGVNFNPSLKTISKALRISLPTVQKHLKSLIKKNMIEKYHQGGTNNVNRYSFVEPGKWKKVETDVVATGGTPEVWEDR